VAHLSKVNEVPKVYYRPEQNLCPTCHEPLRRDHILWHKRVTFSTGDQQLVSWAYRCPTATCPGSKTDFRSCRAEAVHLKYRRFSRELVVRIGYRHFWQHQTMDEIHDWLVSDLHLKISQREVAYLWLDFLALLRAAQSAKIRRKLKLLPRAIIGVDGMQPEKGNDCLYIVRELQCGVTLLAENLEDSSQEALCKRILEPLKELLQALGLSWGGVVSDAQETLRLAIGQSLPGIPHQACQLHCLRDAGKLIFEADRTMKTDLKASLRPVVHRLRNRMLALPADDPFRAVLLDFAAAIRSLLVKGGVAPFEIGGIEVFDALNALETSMSCCQKKATISCSDACSSSSSAVCLLQRKLNGVAGNANGLSTWSIC